MTADLIDLDLRLSSKSGLAQADSTNDPTAEVSPSHFLLDFPRPGIIMLDEEVNYGDVDEHVEVVDDHKRGDDGTFPLFLALTVYGPSATRWSGRWSSTPSDS